MIRRSLAGAALAALIWTGGSAAQTPAEWQDVIRHLRHPNPATRLDAVRRLGAVAYRSAAEPVALLITDPDDRVQLAAIEAQLRFFEADRIGGTRVLGIGGGSGSQAQDAFEAGPLLRGGAPVPGAVLDQLLLAVRDEQARVRFDAIHAFGFLAEAPIADDLARRLAAELDHYDPVIRAATARVIGRLRAVQASEALVAALSDSNSVVRRYAVEALGLLQDARVAVALRDAHYRARGEMVEVTLLALARTGDPGDRDLFRQRAAERNVAIRRAAVEGLGRVGDRESLPLVEGLKNDRAAQVRLAAAYALHRLGQDQSHVIAPMLAVSEVRAQARDYLLEIGPRALPAVTATLGVATDARHRADLVQLIGYLGGAEAIEVLEPLAADADARVRRAVAHAIARLKR